MRDDVVEEIKSKPEEVAAPKVILKQTPAARKKNKPFPTFTQGELLPWKGVWFRLEGIQKTTDGRTVMLLIPQTEVVQVQVKEEVKDEQTKLAE